MPNSRTDGERLAAIEANLKALIDDSSLRRQHAHDRLREQGEFRLDVKTRLSLIEQGQKELIDSNREYRSECTLDRKALESRVGAVERRSADDAALKKYVWRTTFLIGPSVAFLANLAVAWARR